MNILTRVFHQLRDRLYGDTYKEKLQEAVAKYRDGVTVELPVVHLNQLGSEIESDLSAARREANKLLEQIVERSVAERRRLEIIFDSLDDAVFVADYTGKIVDISSKARKLFKLSTEELKEKTLADLFLKSNAKTIEAESRKYFEHLQKIRCTFNCKSCDTDCVAEEMHEMYTNYLRTEKTVLNRPLFFDHRCMDGSLISVQLVLNILTLEVSCAEELNYVAVVRNLTSDKQAKEEALRLRSFHTSLMSVIPIPVFYKGTDLRFTAVSQAFRELLQLSDEDVIGKHANQLFTEECALELNSLDQAALATLGTPQSKTLDLKTLGGIVHAVNVFVRAIRLDGAANTFGVAGSVSHQIFDDTRARAAFFSAVSKAVVFLDHNRRVTGCNDEFIRLTGLVKAEVIGLADDDARIAEFFTPMHVGSTADDVTVRGAALHRVCLPIAHQQTQEIGMVYVFFMQFDKT